MLGLKLNHVSKRGHLWLYGIPSVDDTHKSHHHPHDMKQMWYLWVQNLQEISVQVNNWNLIMMCDYSNIQIGLIQGRMNQPIFSINNYVKYFQKNVYCINIHHKVMALTLFRNIMNYICKPHCTLHSSQIDRRSQNVGKSVPYSFL